jgi:hypothetical protein
MKPLQFRRIMLALYGGLIVASVACSAQVPSSPFAPVAQTSTTPDLIFLAAPADRRKGHLSPHRRGDTGGGTPYNYGSSCPVHDNFTYCYAFKTGDSITLPVHIFTLSDITPPCYSTYYNLQSHLLGAFDFTTSIYPATLSGTGCMFVITGAVTITCNGPSCGGSSGRFISCCGIGTGRNQSTVDSVETINIFPTASHPPTTPLPSPTPGVDIFDWNLSEIVTNTSQDSVAGQAQLMQAVPSEPDLSGSNCDWTPGGNTVGSYNALSITPSPSPAATTNVNPVNFYWIGSGSNSSSTGETVSVSCTPSPGSGSLTASATYYVEQPTFSATSPLVTYLSTAKAYSNGYGPYPGIWIAYAAGPSPDPSSSPGVKWVYSVSNVPTPGQIALLQMGNIYNTAVQPSPGPTTTVLYSTNSSYCLDQPSTASPYPFYAATVSSSSTWSAIDAPAQPIPTPAPQASISYKFIDYYMYEPNSDSVGSSIWITIANGIWDFVTNGTTNGGLVWTLSGTQVGGSPAPLAAASPLPTWNCQIAASAIKVHHRHQNAKGFLEPHRYHRGRKRP